ncbi:MAG: DUF2235 domain-containing protein [Rhodospirillaceae bacterium]|nr:DUF2235 domain-containing protein [Rhodospirillaceae bacterium]
MTKTLNIAQDGTWQSKANERPSNVLRFHKLLSKRGQLTLYIPGVGAGPKMDALGKLLGGAFGLGAHGRVKRAYKWLCKYWEPGDIISLNGFSRGATATRMLASRIAKKGIKRGKTTYYPDIDFMGCWDTVAAFGIPIDIFGIPFQRINLFTNLEIGANVKKAVHLVAMDEARGAFTPNLMNARPDVVKEVHFIGTHSDIGGGESDPGLSNITLAYMIREAKKAGVKFKDTSKIKPNRNGTIHYHRDNSDPRIVHVLVDDKPSQLIPNVHKSATTRKNYKPLAKVNLKKVNLV